MEVTTVGLDLAKRVFQVHAVNAEGAIVLRKALRRGQMLPFSTEHRLLIVPYCLFNEIARACANPFFVQKVTLKTSLNAAGKLILRPDGD
jgi:hypothetical protein